MDDRGSSLPNRVLHVLTIKSNEKAQYCEEHDSIGSHYQATGSSLNHSGGGSCSVPHGHLNGGNKYLLEMKDFTQNLQEQAMDYSLIVEPCKAENWGPWQEVAKIKLPSSEKENVAGVKYIEHYNYECSAGEKLARKCKTSDVSQCKGGKAC